MTATGTVVIDTAFALGAALEVDVPPDMQDRALVVALADATAGHGLTVTWQGSDEGARQCLLGKAGDELVIPLHGITHYTIESDAYPTTIVHGVFRAGASIRTGITRTA